MFTCYAPVDDPEITVRVLVDDCGSVPESIVWSMMGKYFADWDK